MKILTLLEKPALHPKITLQINITNTGVILDMKRDAYNSSLSNQIQRRNLKGKKEGQV